MKDSSRGLEGHIIVNETKLLEHHHTDGKHYVAMPFDSAATYKVLYATLAEALAEAPLLRSSCSFLPPTTPAQLAWSLILCADHLIDYVASSAHLSA